MKTLKDLKDALNKLPDKELDKFFITHCMWLEDPEARLDVVWCDDEENSEDLMKLYDMEGFDIIRQFVRDLTTDAEKVFACKCKPSLEDEEYFMEDTPEKG
jgi:hypothetical protein